MRRGVYALLALGALGASLAMITCSSEDTNATGDPCPNGICGGGGNTGPATGPGGTGGSSGSSSCAEAWLCTPWQTNGADDNGTRTCTDINNCGTINNKPAESAMLPKLDLDYYKCNVEPIFNRGCAHQGCHGTEQGRAFRTYARGRLRITGETWTEPGCLKPGTMWPSEECIGSIECRCWTLPHSAAEWQRNYDSARGFALDAKGAPIPAGMEDQSELIAQPIVGGKAHVGVHLFAAGDPDYVTLKEWLSGTALGMPCVTDN
jgi:hypothetical protein